MACCSIFQAPLRTDLTEDKDKAGPALRSLHHGSNEALRALWINPRVHRRDRVTCCHLESLHDMHLRESTTFRLQHQLHTMGKADHSLQPTHTALVHSASSYKPWSVRLLLGPLHCCISLLLQSHSTIFRTSFLVPN